MRPDNWGSLFTPEHVRYFVAWFARLDDAEKLRVLEVRWAYRRFARFTSSSLVFVTRGDPPASRAVRTHPHIHTPHAPPPRALIVARHDNNEN